jgi:hypothetical protein
MFARQLYIIYYPFFLQFKVHSNSTMSLSWLWRLQFVFAIRAGCIMYLAGGRRQAASRPAVCRYCANTVSTTKASLPPRARNSTTIRSVRLLRTEIPCQPRIASTRILPSAQFFQSPYMMLCIVVFRRVRKIVKCNYQLRHVFLFVHPHELLGSHWKDFN